ncbi:MAG: metal-sulfur cluster assembly factor [Rickettsiales bacterium]|jgi:FeS assembly SUF system protein|nr:metal-sulfur cluster assembly factor [Rickettsiales bacterium]
MAEEKDGLVFAGEVAELPNVVAHAGTKLAPGTVPPVDKERVIDALKTVFDPDVGIDIYNLGLIYDIDPLENGDVKIAMTLTSPTCPIADEMPQMAADAVAALEGAGEVEARLVWEPMWDLSHLSEEAKYQLDMTDLEF